jgi:DNA-binding IclR family transcriptional regulator
MRIGNRVEVGQAAIAEDAKMHRPDVTDAISDLVRLDIIQRGEERGVYYINPHIGFVGDSDAHQAAILRWEESKIKTTVAP